MPQTVTIELPDDVFEPLQREAELGGRTVAELVVARIRNSQRNGIKKRELTPEERAAAVADLMKHTVDLGYATGTDNEQIDRDLAREYMDTHEDES